MATTTTKPMRYGMQASDLRCDFVPTLERAAYLLDAAQRVENRLRAMNGSWDEYGDVPEAVKRDVRDCLRAFDIPFEYGIFTEQEQ